MGASRTTSAHTVDITSAQMIKGLFTEVGQVDAIISVAGDNKFAPMTELTDGDYQYGFDSKLMGQVNLVRVGVSTT